MQIKQKIDVVLSFIQKLPDNCTIKYTKNIQNQVDGSIQVGKWFESFSRLTTFQCEIFQELQNYVNLIRDYSDQFSRDVIQGLMNKLQPCYSRDEQMQKLTQLKKLTFQDDDTYTIQEDAQIEFDTGIVYLLYFWGEGESPYEQMMETCYQMIEKNPQWQGKFRFIGLNHNHNVESFIQEIKSKNWKSFDTLKQYLLEELYNQYRNGFPMIINKWGRILDVGYYPECLFEEKINELIAAESDHPQNELNIVTLDSLTEAEYKEARKQMKKLSAVIGEVGYIGTVNLQMEKVSFLKPNGTKVHHSCTKLKLQYDVDVKNLNQINTFLNNEWKQIPENMKEITGKFIQDQEGSYQKFREVFSSVGAEVYYEYIDNTYLILDGAQSPFQVNKIQDQLLLAENLDLNQYIKAEAILEELTNQTHYNFWIFLEQLKNDQLKYRNGLQFVSSLNYKKWKEEELTEIKHVPGQVMIIYFWETQSVIDDIKYFVALLEKNKEKWGKSVRIALVCLCLDSYSRNEMKDNEQYAQYLDFYFPDSSQFSSAFERVRLGAERNCCIVVDKFGMIRLSQRDHDYQLIDDLLLEQYPNTVEEEGDFTKEQAEQNLINFTQQAEIKEKLLQIENPSLLQLYMHLEQHKIQDQIKFRKPKLEIQFRDFQLQDVNWILENLFSIIPENKWKINKQILKTISVQYPGSVCAVCSKDILQQPQQYYSPFKKEHVCIECAEFDDQTKIGAERFKYLDSLIFINGPLTDLSVLINIEEEKIGKNLQLKQGEEGSQNHDMICNGCNSRKQHRARYKPVNASKGFLGDIDYCQACFFVLKDKKSEKAQKIIAKDQNNGMTEDNLLIRILFNYGSYRAF